MCTLTAVIIIRVDFFCFCNDKKNKFNKRNHYPNLFFNLLMFQSSACNISLLQKFSGYFFTIKTLR